MANFIDRIIVPCPVPHLYDFLTTNEKIAILHAYLALSR